MAIKHKYMTMEEVAGLIQAAGVTGDDAVTVLAVIWGESGGDAFAINGPITKDDPDNPGHLSLDRGLVQWNSGWWPVKDKDAFDPEVAVQLMVNHIKQPGKSVAEWLLTWNAFKNLSFVRHVPAAYDAFASLDG